MSLYALSACAAMAGTAESLIATSLNMKIVVNKLYFSVRFSSFFNDTTFSIGLLEDSALEIRDFISLSSSVAINLSNVPRSIFAITRLTELSASSGAWALFWARFILFSMSCHSLASSLKLFWIFPRYFLVPWTYIQLSCCR